MFTTTSSDATTMAWNWVIQSIAKFKQVDSSTLAGLVDKAPAISVDLGKDAKEMVSLRILESLFLHGNEAAVDSDSAQNAKISFDPSDHCESVLNKILEETSEQMTELETRKWNIRPFITHKRGSLPKSPAQKFKEALLEGSHPILESLKEMSKLGGAKVSENTIPEVNVSFTEQTTSTKDDLVSLKTENRNSELQESPLQKSDHEVEDSNKGITEDIGRKEHETTVEPPVKVLDESTLMDHMEHIVSKGPEQSCDNIDHGQKQLPGEDDDNDKDPDDERTDIAAKKEAFLSSQCSLGQDFMSTADFTEIFLCMKCNKGGQLLICSSDTCPFRVHESCLGSAATFDGNEIFFCPFCSYSHAISKYMEVKRKASLARKDLQAFLTSGVKRTPKISSKTGGCLDKDILTQVGATGEKFKLNASEHAMSRCKDCAPADSLHPPTHQAGMGKHPCKDEECPMSSTASHSKRARKQKPQYTSTITLPRRTNLFWEKAEEEMLKEGMKRFSCEDNNRIPWKKILDFGRDVFDKRRTTIDLKDKWRNICKENPAIKKQKI